MAVETKYSKHRYIEYQVGSMNLVLSVPHGGRLRPAHIPQRDAGYLDPVTGQPRYDHSSKATKDPINCSVRYKKDTNTIDLATHIADEVKNLTGKRPHVIICHIHRNKLDMNCDKEKATFCVPTADEAWTAYHKFVNDAKLSFNGTGLFLDIHGQAHQENWVELGYTISSAMLNEKSYVGSDTSIRFLANRFKDRISLEDLICGLDSFGGLLLDEGYKVVPSPTYPGPGSGNYYNGGHNTRTHGSRYGGIVDGIQIETPRFLREKTMIPEYSRALARTIVKFLELYYSNSEEGSAEKERKEEAEGVMSN